jgi:hypothetical protein
MGMLNNMKKITTRALSEWKIRVGLEWHLQSNHYPPLPKEMVDVCFRVIKKVNDGESDALVRLPKGMKYKGKSLVPVQVVVEWCHLYFWLE